MQTCGDFTFTEDQYNMAIAGTLNPTEPPPPTDSGYANTASTLIIMLMAVILLIM